LSHEKNLTQAQLGEMIGVKRSEISKLERGSRNMTIDNVLKIFRALQADIKFVVESKNHESHLK
jgi:transcriptional regulator with XRE-family HTH domain